MKKQNSLSTEQRQELYQRFLDAQSRLPKRSITSLFFSTYPDLDSKKGRVLFFNMTYNRSHNKDITERMEILAKHIALAKVRASDEYECLRDIG